jgi:hypothetical protein
MRRHEHVAHGKSKPYPQIIEEYPNLSIHKPLYGHVCKHLFSDGTLFQVKIERLEIPSSTLSKELTSTESVIKDKWENWLGVPVPWLDEIIISPGSRSLLVDYKSPRVSIGSVGTYFGTYLKIRIQLSRKK